MAKEPKEKQAPVTRKEVVLDLRCDLTEPEKMVVGAELAHAINDLVAAKERKTSVTSQITSEIKALDSTVAAKGRLLSNGYEYRPVKCEEVRDFGAGVVFVTRSDTGAQIRSRPMEESERQPPLPLPGEPGQTAF